MGSQLPSPFCHQRFYGGSNTFYHSVPEDSTSFFVVTKESYEYGGIYDLTFNLVDCPGLDSCSEAGSISELPFASADCSFKLNLCPTKISSNVSFLVAGYI